MTDTLQTLATAVAGGGAGWPDVAIEIWRDVRGEVLTGLIAFLVGWLGVKKPRLRKYTRSTDRLQGEPRP